MALAAAVLLATAIGGYWYHYDQLAAIAAEHLRVRFSAPAELRPTVASRFVLKTTGITDVTVPAEVEFALLGPGGEPLLERSATVGEDGRLTIETPTELALPTDDVGLEVRVRHGEAEEAIVADLPVARPSYFAYVRTDHARYQPGNSVRFRSVMLGSLSHEPPEPTSVTARLVDDGGQSVPGLQLQKTTRRGVMAGTFGLPADLAAGEYVVLVEPDEPKLPTGRRAIWVAADAPSSLAPGDGAAKDDASAKDADGSSADASAEDGPRAEGSSPDDPEQDDAMQEDSGDAAAGQAGSEETTEEDASDTERPSGSAGNGTADELPAIETLFFPEGGHLVAGLENRVYFRIRGRQAAPVTIQGRVVDSADRTIVLASSGEQGRGSFSMVPRAGEAYRLRFTTPGGADHTAALPAVGKRRPVVMSTGVGVFEGGRPIEFVVRSGEGAIPMVAAVYEGDSLVGQQALITEDPREGRQPPGLPVATSVNSVQIDLPASVAGVLRVMLFDYSVSPPRPLAGRLIYRRAAEQLSIGVETDALKLVPDRISELGLQIRDERGEPVEGLAGVTLVEVEDLVAGGEPATITANDEAGPKPRSGTQRRFPSRELPDEQPSLTAFARLVSRLPDDSAIIDGAMLDADAYLRKAPEARVALDLLLGTQPLSADRGATAETAPRPPLVWDNLADLQQQHQESLDRYRRSRTRALNALTTLSFFAGMALVTAVAMLGMLGVINGPRLWLPSVAVAVCCLLIGALLLDPLAVAGRAGRAVPFMGYHPSTSDNGREEAGDLNRGGSSDGGNQPAEAPRPPSDAPDPAAEAATEPGETVATGGWLPLVVCDEQGRASVRLRTPDDLGKYRLKVDAQGQGRLGSISVPITVVAEDE